MARQKLTYESRIELAKQRIHEKPQRALQEIGKFLVKEIKAAAPRSLNVRHVITKVGDWKEIKPGRLKKSFSYWYRKKEGDLQIGSKAFYAPMVHTGIHGVAKNEFFLQTVEKNVGVVQDMIMEALKELEKDE